MRKHPLWLAALGLALAACSGQAAGRPDRDGTLLVVGREMQFESDQLEVAAGQPVTLVFHNDGTLEHALVIDELGVAITHIAPGQDGTVTFTPDQAGVYTFYCSVPGHKEARMTGTLQVKP